MAFTSRIKGRAIVSPTLVFALALSIHLVDANPLFSAANGDAPVRRALLIGINDYKAVPTLQGSLNDIDTMRQILVSRWGFLPDHIREVRNQAATRAGILAALELLVQETQPADTVYVHYSGHGSQVKDLNGDEKDDGLDETIVPHDGRTEGIADITDDELDQIFAKLKARSVLIVMDSCHSGTATRSASVRTRSVPQDMRTDLYRHVATGTRGVIPVVTSRYVVMTGAASHQEALDGPVDGRYHGFFTYALARSLNSAPPTASPRDIFSGVERELKRIQGQFGRSSMPEPQLEAPPALMDRPLLEAGVVSTRESAATTTRLSWIEAAPSGKGKVRLVNGQTLNAAPRSVWAIYPPGESQFPIGQALATASVTDAQGMDAIATLEPASATILSGSRAVSLLPPPAIRRVPIRLLVGTDETRISVETSLRTQVSDIEFVTGEQFARFLLSADGNAITVSAADGLQTVGTFPLSDPTWAEQVGRVLSVSANAADLLTLENPTTRLRLDVQVAATPPAAGSRGISVVAANTGPSKYRVRRPSDRRNLSNSLQLVIQSNSACYLTVVDVDSQGGLNLLFPNPYQSAEFLPDGRISAGSSIRIPDSLVDDNRAGFYWDYTPPTGLDTVRTFCSTDRDTAKKIRGQVQALQTRPGAQTRGGATTRAAMTDSIGSLRESLAGVATRGIRVVQDTGGSILSTPITPEQAADWTATAITIHVSE